MTTTISITLIVIAVMLLLLLLAQIAIFGATRIERGRMLESMENQAGHYLVTKVWYSDGHRSSNIVYAKDAKSAYDKESDARRNLDYFIESCKKCNQVKF